MRHLLNHQAVSIVLLLALLALPMRWHTRAARVAAAPNETYTIAGRVTDAGGAALPGVNVSAVPIVPTALDTLQQDASRSTPTAARGVMLIALVGLLVASVGARRARGRLALTLLLLAVGGHTLRAAGSAAPQFSAITDDTGSFTIGDLGAGSYNVLPTLAGTLFSPTAHVVQLPPGVDALHFTRRGGALVTIAAATFPMGCDVGHNGGYDCQSEAVPLHNVQLSSYRIDLTEVTNAQYALCVAADACRAPYFNSSATRPAYYDDPTYANWPVVNVDWYMANEFCAWAGRRLPSEAEWERAARGTTIRAFPWGDDAPTCGLANAPGCHGDTVSVGSYAAGSSPYGVLDMAGNVLEWTNDWLADDYYSQSPSTDPPGPTDGYFKVARGGSFTYYNSGLLVAARDWASPANYSVWVGFRCAASATD